MYFHFKLEIKSPNCQIESLSLSVFGINILYWIVSDSLKYRPQAVLEKTKKNKNRPIEKKYVAKQRIANLVYQNTAAAETFVFALTYFFLYPNQFIWPR